MERKSIKEFSKELFNNRYVNFSIEGFDTSIGKIVYEESSENDLDFYILQNNVDGVPCDIVDPLFKYSYYYDSDIEIFELTESEISKIAKNEELLKTLKKNTELFIDGNFRKITENSGGSLKVSGVVAPLNILSDFWVVSNRNTFLKEFYKPLLDSEFIASDSKDLINRHCDSQDVYDGNIYMKLNGILFSLRIYRNGLVTYDGISSYNEDYPDCRIRPTFPSDLNFTKDGIAKMVKLIKGEFESDRTYFHKSFMAILKNINCEETVKSTLVSGNYYHNMQFIKYDQATEMISFTPKGKTLVYDETGKITDKNRQTVKAHKFFNTILKGTTSEYDIKCIADKVLAFFNSWTVKYFKGKKVAENYSTVNTRNWSTQSCMDRKAENFFELYTQTPFRLGVIYREGEIVGRFIEVTCEDKFVYNDRLYFSDETVLAWYNSWVDDKKMNRKEKNSQDSKENFYNVDKGNFKKKVTVKLRKKLDNITIFPYLDTLAYGYKDKLQNFDSNDVRYTFTSTTGTAGRTRCRIDAITQKWIDDTHAVKIEFGNKSGEYTTVENLIFSVQNQKHCLK